MTLLLMLLIALGFGAGDFLAGLASKKVSALTVSLYSQGVAVGFSFVFLGLASSGGPLWPVLMTLAGSIPPILFFRFRNGKRHVGVKGVWLLITSVGVCQGFALFAFAVAVADGYISIVSVAGALSPVATSLLAFAILCERLTRRQVVAVGIAIAGIICLIPG